MIVTVVPALAENPLSKAKLLELVSSGVDDPVVIQLIERDCVDFDLTADVVLELSARVSGPVLNAAIRCREASVAEASESSGAGGDPEAAEGLAPDTIMVLPFSGTTEFTSLAAESLSNEIAGKVPLRLIQPQETEIARVRAALKTSGAVSVSEARTVGSSSGAQYVLMGDINAYRRGGSLNAIATLKLIDVPSGTVLASAQKACGLLIANSQQQCVVRAVRRATRELMPSLRRLGSG
ncbi:MAG: hypothetical protein KDD11_23950 [Acidobacteria bacterium]|nr:hypothetical protein [Acidobacteriota bacterium]